MSASPEAVNEEPPSRRRVLLTGGIVAAFGFAVMLIALDVIPQRIFRPNVPSWVLLVVGIVIALAGSSVFFRLGTPAANRMVGAAMFLMGIAFLWIALFGEARHMSGGLPFLSRAANVALGRIAFTAGAAFLIWIGVTAWRTADRRVDVNDPDDP